MSWLECSYYAEEFGECTDVHFREVVLLELAEVAVIADDVSGSCDDSTVDKLIVIRVRLDKVEAVGGIYTLDIRCLYQFLHHSVGDKGVIPLSEYLVILKQNLVGDAQHVFGCTESLPDVIVIRSWHDDVDEAIGIEYDFHLLP